jgi:hypothetical protein
MTRLEQAERRDRIDNAVLDIIQKREVQGRRYGYMCRAHAANEYRRRFGENEFGGKFDYDFWYALVGKSIQRLKSQNKIKMVDGLGRDLSSACGSSTHWREKTAAK